MVEEKSAVVRLNFVLGEKRKLLSCVHPTSNFRSESARAATACRQVCPASASAAKCQLLPSEGWTLGQTRRDGKGRNNNKETSDKCNKLIDITVEMVPWCLGKSVMRALYDEGFFDDGTQYISVTYSNICFSETISVLLPTVTLY